MIHDAYGHQWRRQEFRVTWARLRRGDWLVKFGVIGAALWLMGAVIS